MRLYTYWRSSAAYRVRIALALKGVDFESVPVHLVRGGGEQHGAAYKRLNPGGRVPTLEVDGQAIYQSMAILEWLEETHPQTPLLPADPIGRARVRGIAQMIVSDIQPLQNISVTHYLRDEAGLEGERVAAWLRHWISRGMAAVEQALDDPATGRFCHGDSPTFADLCLVPQCYASRRFGVDTAAYPRITAIELRCAALPAFRVAAPEAQPDAEVAPG